MYAHSPVCWKRKINLEDVESFEIDAFLRAFSIFTACRSLPSLLITDSAKN